MALQASGQISLSEIQTEFGGANPIGVSEYYKNGTYVPSTLGGAAGTWSSYTGGGGNFTYTWEVEVFGTYYFLRIYWNNLEIYSSSATGIEDETQINGVNDLGGTGYDYGRGTTATYTQGAKAEPSYYRYAVRRRTSETAETVNASIPTSGTISMSQFYGGRKT